MLHCNMTIRSDDDPVSPDPVPPAPGADDKPWPSPQAFSSKVYPSTDATGWIVEPPRDLASVEDNMIFRGPTAQRQALTYAYEKFGNARFFPY